MITSIRNQFLTGIWTLLVIFFMSSYLKLNTVLFSLYNLVLLSNMATSENHIQLTSSYHARFLSVTEPKPIETLDEFQNSKSLNYIKVQTLDDRAELIRSNKTIMKRNLKNSLQTKLLAIPINPKEENLTAASLKDLDSD